LDKSEWDLKTDMEFVRLLSLYGCDWMEIQKYMPERPYPQIKNRYYGRVAKIIAKKLNISLK
jgi:RNase P/RNase MRP subunit p30